MEAVGGWVIAAGGAIAAAVGTYLLGRRTASGSVETTDAQTLWQEATAYRQVLIDQNAAKDRRIQELERMLSERDSKGKAPR